MLREPTADGKLTEITARRTRSIEISRIKSRRRGANRPRDDAQQSAQKADDSNPVHQPSSLEKRLKVYLISTFAPTSSSLALIFSASSFGMPVLTGLGAL